MAEIAISKDTPDEACVRVSTVAKLLDCSVATLWRKSAAGQFPKPTKLFAGVTVWRVGDVRAWLKSQSQVAA